MRDDGLLKQFIIGLMVSGIYQHADERYEPLLRQGHAIQQHLLFVEDAHVVMRSDASTQTMEIFPVVFVDISGVAPPSDAELAMI